MQMDPLLERKHYGDIYKDDATHISTVQYETSSSMVYNYIK